MESSEAREGNESQKNNTQNTIAIIVNGLPSNSPELFVRSHGKAYHIWIKEYKMNRAFIEGRRMSATFTNLSPKALRRNKIVMGEK